MVKKTVGTKYSKSAFLDAEEDVNKRHILNVLLEDDKSYAVEEVTETVNEWKSKEVKHK